MGYLSNEEQSVITVEDEEVRTSQDGKRYQLVRDVDGNMYAIWEKFVYGVVDFPILLRRGAKYAIFYKINGKYKNITGAQEIEQKGNDE